MEQTAVEWLENEFQEMCKDFGGIHSDFIVKFDQAKAMEKEQIMKAYKDNNYARYVHDSEVEQYYEKTYKND